LGQQDDRKGSPVSRSRGRSRNSSLSLITRHQLPEFCVKQRPSVFRGGGKTERWQPPTAWRASEGSTSSNRDCDTHHRSAPAIELTQFHLKFGTARRGVVKHMRNSIMTNRFDTPSIDAIEMKNDLVENLSPEQLEMISGGGFWDVIADIVRQLPPIPPIILGRL